MGEVLTKFGRVLSEKNAPFFDRISSVGRNHKGLLTWMASCATEGCAGELPLEMLRRHGNQKCNQCVYTVIFDGECVSKKLQNEKSRIVAVAKIPQGKSSKWTVKDWWMRCGKDGCMNVFRCYEFVRYAVNFCTEHRQDKRRRPPYAALFNYCKLGAGHRKKEWLLTLVQFALLCRLPSCFYCQCKLNRIPSGQLKAYVDGTKEKIRYTMYLDRVDTKRGYFAGNVVPCCRLCNLRKNSKRTGEEFSAIVAKERGDLMTQNRLLAGDTWKQLFKRYCAPHLSAAEFKQICP
jgi:hypothetical protein